METHDGTRKKARAIEMNIHPTAIVKTGASIGENTMIGAYSIIGSNVSLGKNCIVQEHVIIRGHTTIGEGTIIFPFAVVGGEPQHLGYKGEPTRVEIGSHTTLRESVTIHRGTPFGHGVTKVGDHSYIMAYSHVAHDCTVGKNVIIANGLQMAGHVTIEDFATIGGNCAIAQHCRIGRYCYVGGSSTLRKDLPPFLTGKGNVFDIQGINAVGLERLGFSSETIRRIKNMYKIFYLQKLNVSEATDKILTEIGEVDEVKVFLDFVKTSKVGLTR